MLYIFQLCFAVHERNHDFRHKLRAGFLFYLQRCTDDGFRLHHCNRRRGNCQSAAPVSEHWIDLVQLRHFCRDLFSTDVHQRRDLGDLHLALRQEFVQRRIEQADCNRSVAHRKENFFEILLLQRFESERGERAGARECLPTELLLRGSERWPDMRAISMRLDELYGATLGTLVRLRGETKLTGFYADFIEEAFLPAGEAVFAPMVEFFRDILFHPALENGLLNARYVESEKQNLIHAIESAQNDKRVYAAMRMRRIMCEGEAASIHRLGYAEDVAAITPEALTAHWRTVLRTAPIMLFYAGRRTPQEAAALFRPLFDGLERDPVSPPPTVVCRSAETVREVTESMDVTQGKLVIGMRTGITASDPDYPALVLLNSVYGSGVTSKLFVNVREKRSLCYYASSAVEKFKGLMIVSSGISFDQYETARDAILAELDACRRGEITPEELESARRSLISAVRAGLDTPAALDDWYIGMSIEPCDDPETMLQKLPALTVGDVVRAARRITTDTIYFLKGDEA